MKKLEMIYEFLYHLWTKRPTLSSEKTMFLYDLKHLQKKVLKFLDFYTSF